MIKVRKFLPYILIALIFFGIGFFAGMEYKAWEIRKAISDVFAPITKENKTTTEMLKSTTPVPKKDLNKKVDVTVENKEFKEVGYQSFIVIPVKIHNYTDKDIKGISGTLTFYDIFGNEIKRITLPYDDVAGLPRGTVTDYEAGMDFNQFIDLDVKLRDTDFQNLKYKWVTEKIVYNDGTEEAN